jgi:hypothetical protein
MLSKRVTTVRGLAVVLAATAVCLGSSQTTEYNGHWWLLQTSEEKSGYLVGDSDCYGFEFKAKAAYSKSIAEEQEYVTNVYRNNPDKRSAPVFDVIRAAEQQPPSRKVPGGGEAWTEPHGYCDGQWWRGRNSADRIGFVEGYIACYARSPRAHGTFSKTPAEYVRLINQWYILNEESGESDPSRVAAKIADVLFKFRDHPDGR